MSGVRCSSVANVMTPRPVRPRSVASGSRPSWLMALPLVLLTLWAALDSPFFLVFAPATATTFSTAPTPQDDDDNLLPPGAVSISGALRSVAPSGGGIRVAVGHSSIGSILVPTRIVGASRQGSLLFGRLNGC